MDEYYGIDKYVCIINTPSAYCGACVVKEISNYQHQVNARVLCNVFVIHALHIKHIKG